MRISIRDVLIAFALVCIVPGVVVTHLLWKRTADVGNQRLLENVEQQISDAVKRELGALILNAESAYGAIRTIFLQNVIEPNEADKREFVFLSQLQAQPTLSWIAFGWPDGTFFASHKLGAGSIEMMEIELENHVSKRRVDTYRVITGDIEFERRVRVPTDYRVSEQRWYRASFESERPAWFLVSEVVDYTKDAISFAGPIDIYHKRHGVLAVSIELSRVSRFLASLEVGRAGAAFIIASDGRLLAWPDPAADETRQSGFHSHPLVALVLGLAPQMSKTPASAPQADRVRQELNGHFYNTRLIPLGFMGWVVAVVVPEGEFLADIKRTETRLIALLALVTLIVAAGAVILARRLAQPLQSLVADFGNVQRLAFGRPERALSRINELNQLTLALERMVVGLSAFAKYVPKDLVAQLIEAGVEAKPGGAVKPVTVMFADMPGFTHLSEKLGNDVIPVIEAFLDAATTAVEDQKGTIDKFVGDSVMAFWGAPRDQDDHAFHACKAALEIEHKLSLLQSSGSPGQAIGVRIGINTGVAVVGNIGTQSRLNYTVLGDAVNLASRLEAANKLYRTNIIVGEETACRVENRVIMRELDRIVVFGRDQATAIFELIALGQGNKPAWIEIYETALFHYRRREWAYAHTLFRRVVSERGEDWPSEVLSARCDMFEKIPPPSAWDGVTTLQSK